MQNRSINQSLSTSEYDRELDFKILLGMYKMPLNVRVPSKISFWFAFEVGLFIADLKAMRYS